MTENELIARKRALLRAKNRGCKETDILLGKYAEENLDKMSATEVQVFEQLLEEDEGLIYDWMAGKAEVPAEYKTILSF